ncbi:MAG TPA: glutamyl-tRNA amidotransferase [Cytophagales bacterium]|nr:glutamyl-tRNA amidotransferase [Cytophagales bacterium]HAA23418.1 glutamyl-tRNA amidotransferase [Cytophagales bacterium]HAP58101.1 glutamyl-tRNA amidotransferase [Cytophagales bacterium]
MSLKDKVGEAMKTAMKAKDKEGLAAIRAIKSAILLAETEGGAKGEIDEATELKLLQKLVKQRRESAEIYSKENRQDLADVELNQAKVIEQFLPKQLDDEELKVVLEKIIAEVGATSKKDMGKIMGAASKQLAGQADGKRISAMVGTLLS